MATKDKIKWDKKYKENPVLLQDRDVSKKLKYIVNDIQDKNALDIACGTGRNSIYLANFGFDVEALDISEVAINSLEEKKIPNITTKLIDLEGFVPEKNSYDLIVMANYLDREIIPHLSLALKQNGVLFIETYMEHEDNTKPNSNPAFLLKKDELKTYFNDEYKILEYEEFDNESYELYRMKKQYITVIKL